MAAEPPGAGSAPAAELGAHLRAAREAAGISLRELARRLDVTPSLLSQVERGLAQPSVATLWAVVSELGLSLDALFATELATDAEVPARPPIVQRAGDRTAIDLEGGVRWERLTPSPDPDVGFAFVSYEPGRDAGTAHPPARHRGTEYGYLISGRLAVEVGDDAFELGPGDSIVFASETPHRFRAVGEEPTCAVWWNLDR
jgi:transcriptional regulator with XRE-family HTH domain